MIDPPRLLYIFFSSRDLYSTVEFGFWVFESVFHFTAMGRVLVLSNHFYLLIYVFYFTLRSIKRLGVGRGIFNNFFFARQPASFVLLKFC